MAIWRRIAWAEFGLTEPDATTALKGVINLTKSSADGWVRPLMRFPNPIQVCGDCNNLDAVMKLYEPGGKRRFPKVSSMKGFP